MEKQKKNVTLKVKGDAPHPHRVHRLPGVEHLSAARDYGNPIERSVFRIILSFKAHPFRPPPSTPASPPDFTRPGPRPCVRSRSSSSLAFWLRSCVVSVLISLTTYMGPPDPSGFLLFCPSPCPRSSSACTSAGRSMTLRLTLPPCVVRDPSLPSLSLFFFALGRAQLSVSGSGEETLHSSIAVVQCPYEISSCGGLESNERKQCGQSSLPHPPLNDLAMYLSLTHLKALAGVS